MSGINIYIVSDGNTKKLPLTSVFNTTPAKTNIKSSAEKYMTSHQKEVIDSYISKDNYLIFNEVKRAVLNATGKNVHSQTLAQYIRDNNYEKKLLKNQAGNSITVWFKK